MATLTPVVYRPRGPIPPLKASGGLLTVSVTTKVLRDWVVNPALNPIETFKILNGLEGVQSGKDASVSLTSADAS